MAIFNFKDEETLGKVASVDTTNVIVDVENIAHLKRLQVNHLAVLQSSRPGQHLIGLITQVTRKRGIENISDDGIVEQNSELNLCRIATQNTLTVSYWPYGWRHANLCMRFPQLHRDQ